MRKNCLLNYSVEISILDIRNSIVFVVKHLTCNSDVHVMCSIKPFFVDLDKPRVIVLKDNYSKNIAYLIFITIFRP